MAEPYYNITEYGQGMEGFLNYANLLVDTWFVNAFLMFVFIVSVYVLSKSEWKLPGVVSFSFFICLITSFIFRLFTVVNPLIIFILIAGLGVSIAWAIISEHSK